ncbi:MAG: DEAD/DEAH box helicase [Thermoflavifilum sp.]|nr:DEAD/DEAH box helicase [Thermoflavifilum sp.]
MPLPEILKFVYSNGTDEVIRRGKRIYATGGVTLLEADPVLHTASFRVKNDTHEIYYKVTVNKFLEPGALHVRCQCPYNLGEICRHEAAALFQLQDLLDKQYFQHHQPRYDQRHTVVKMKQIDLKILKLLSSQDLFNQAEQLIRLQPPTIIRAGDESVCMEVMDHFKHYQVHIKRNEERYFDTSCSCEEQHYPLCVHKLAVFLHLLDHHGPYYFDTLRNWDKEKAKLLAAYGYTLQDNWQEKFAFHYVNGKPYLRVLDPAVKKIQTVSLPTHTEEKSIPTNIRIAVVWNTHTQYFPYCQLDVVVGEYGEEQQFMSKLEKLPLDRYVEVPGLPEKDRKWLSLMRKLQPAEIQKYLHKNSPFWNIWEEWIDTAAENSLRDPSNENKQLIIEYLFPKLQKLGEAEELNHRHFWLPPGKPYQTAHLIPLQVHTQTATLCLQVSDEKQDIVLRAFVCIQNQHIPISQNNWSSPLGFLINNHLYLWPSQEVMVLAAAFIDKEALHMPREEWPQYAQKQIIPHAHLVELMIDESLCEQITQVYPSPAVELKELDDLLIIQPIFYYHHIRVEWQSTSIHWEQKGEKLIRIERNLDAESQFIAFLQSLHPQFTKPTQHPYFYLKSHELTKKGWILYFLDQLKSHKVAVLGIEQLKHFKFNTHYPKTNLHISAQVDWFEAKVDVRFGDQQVSVRDIKKALQKEEQIIPLADGTLGVLPEEWLKKYALLFRVGEEHQQGLKISSYNFGIIDELYEHIDDDQLLIELEEKKRRLLKYDENEWEPIPEAYKSILRPYQQAGFQWLNYLDRIGWGGILADDMGLGKTVQALSFIWHIKQKRGRCFTLVICPTTLIYNWENEILKFTPDLHYHIHHGPARTRKASDLQKYDLIISTYGTLRMDVKLFLELQFDYVVLDESQAIKNPHSKVAKAAMLLKTRNRLALSGTPMQNNTFDIYAQMHFLNPGMLGSIDFFKNEFAIPIDKFQDEERKEHLRKLIYPFILRRTKEQVAPELPEKTEITIYCEMDEAQRSIYEYYRQFYRSRILDSMDELGFERSQFTILQGLTLLRQICDSPAILKQASHPNVSAKLEELTRELSENVGQHKVLVFSQFLGMLDLIKQQLIKLNIPFAYFDGSTPSHEREQAIQLFQQNEDYRVFLISLKAGGVGLNLTAADYVYIVDPWWNPAVEQQAIDRTHRIGQDKNIFAYRLICKNTVEDKIIALQEKKKSLVKDIIADDTAFIKKLTREDVMYLFS